MEHSSASETINNDVGATSDIFELISGWGDCKLESNMTHEQLAQLRSRLNSNASLVEKFLLEREQQEATERSQQSHEICRTCKLIKDPRQRKVAEIRQLHLQILKNNKPADLLCTPGIFSRLEEMALDGRLDTLVADGGCPCPKRRKINDTSAMNKLIRAEVVDILKQELASPDIKLIADCCMARACTKCVHFVLSSLRDEEIQLSVSSNVEGSLHQLVSEINELKQQFSKLSAEMSIQKLSPALNEINLKIDLLKKQLKNNEVDKCIETKKNETDFVEFFGVPNKLAPFSGKAWECPRLAVKMWEEYLKRANVPKEQWFKLVFEVLEGEAEDWGCYQNSSVKNWDQFPKTFVKHFDEDMKAKVTGILRKYTVKDIMEFSEELEDLYHSNLKRVLLACLRAVGNDEKRFVKFINSILFQDQMTYNMTFTDIYIRLNDDKRSENINLFSRNFHHFLKAVLGDLQA